MSRRFAFLMLLAGVAVLGIGAFAALHALEQMYASTAQLDELAGELRTVANEPIVSERRPSSWCLVDSAGNVLGRDEEAERVFFAMIESTGADMKVAVARLRRNRDFQELWSYLGSQRREIRLHVDPSFANPVNGKPLFGGYSHESRTILINTAHPEVKANPLELLDTLIHECIHAALHSRQINDKLARLANVPERQAFPLPADLADGQTDALWQQAVKELGLSVHDIRDLKGKAQKTEDARRLALRQQLELNYGPASSNPAGQFEDLNTAAQSYLVDILQDVRTATGLAETISFDRLKKLRIARNELPPLPFRKRA